MDVTRLANRAGATDFPEFPKIKTLMHDMITAPVDFSCLSSHFPILEALYLKRRFFFFFAVGGNMGTLLNSRNYAFWH